MPAVSRTTTEGRRRRTGPAPMSHRARPRSRAQRGAACGRRARRLRDRDPRPVPARGGGSRPGTGQSPPSRPCTRVRDQRIGIACSVLVPYARVMKFFHLASGTPRRVRIVELRLLRNWWAWSDEWEAQSRGDGSGDELTARAICPQRGRSDAPSWAQVPVVRCAVGPVAWPTATVERCGTCAEHPRRTGQLPSAGMRHSFGLTP